MSRDERTSEAPPNAADVRLQLERILASSGFANSERLKNFLRYSVERSLQADWDHLKETVIGVEVLGRPVGYDPKADAIVRVEAYRLRQRLAEYYDGPGREDPIRITLPKGSYAVQFVHHEEKRSSTETGIGSDTSAPAESQPQTTPQRATWIWGTLAGAVVMALLLAVFRMVNGSSPAVPVAQRLTSDGGWSGEATFTPDGQGVIYSSDRGVDENVSLWRMPVNGGEPVRLTHEPFDAVEADASSDGKWIVYRSKRGDSGGLYLLPASGGPSKLLVQGGSRPRFSPDGRWIVYTVRNEQEWSPGKIYVILTEGGAPREMAPNFADAHYALWSNDGSAILFCGTRISGMPEAEHDWWVLPFPNGQPVKTGVYPNIVQFLQAGSKVPPNPFIETPAAWIGGYVYFSSPLGNGPNVPIWRLRLDANTYQWTGQPAPERQTAGAAIEVAPRVFGNRMIFASSTYNSDIWSQPVKADSAEVQGRAQRLVSHPAPDTFPAMSTDQKFLAFASERSGRRQIHVRALPGGEERIASRSRHLQDFAVFSRAGRRVAFREMRDPKVAIIVADAAVDGQTKEVCADCGAPTDWSPDDRYLLFEPGATIAYVGRLNLATGEQQPFLTHPERSLRSARYSPDGRWIAFHEETGKDARRIWLARADRSTTIKEWIPVTDGNYEDVNPVWSPDGKLIYYLSNRDGHRCVYAQRIDLVTGRPTGDRIEVQHFHGRRRSLLSLTRSRVAAVGLAILPDRMIFALDEQSSDLFLTSVF